LTKNGCKKCQTMRVKHSRLHAVGQILVQWNKIRFKRLLQLRFDFDSTSIRLWFDYDDDNSTTVRLQFDSSKWASWQYVNEGMNSYHTTFYLGSVWKGYTNVDNRRMLPDVDPSAWMPFLLPWRTLLRHYIPRPLPSYWPRHLSTRRKNEHVCFSSQSNRSRIAILIAALDMIRWNSAVVIWCMVTWKATIGFFYDTSTW